MGNINITVKNKPIVILPPPTTPPVEDSLSLRSDEDGPCQRNISLEVYTNAPKLVVTRFEGINASTHSKTIHGSETLELSMQGAKHSIEKLNKELTNLKVTIYNGSVADPNEISKTIIFKRKSLSVTCQDQIIDDLNPVQEPDDDNPKGGKDSMLSSDFDPTI